MKKYSLELVRLNDNKGFEEVIAERVEDSKYGFLALYLHKNIDEPRLFNISEKLTGAYIIRDASTKKEALTKLNKALEETPFSTLILEIQRITKL
jgi:hypothetical protein